MNNVILSGIDHGEIFVHYETHGGGMGAGLAVRISGAHSHMTNTLNTPIEELSWAPLEISEYRLADVERPAKR